MRHVQVIVTECGADVQVARVIIGDSHASVTRRSRECMRQVIQSSLPPEHWPPEQCPPKVWPEDFEAVLKRGSWWTEVGSEPFSVLILSPERIEHTDPPLVEVSVEGGCVTEVVAPSPIRVRVKDYDTLGICDGRIVTDVVGRPCIITMWGEAVSDG